jgi:hypothetical protein
VAAAAFAASADVCAAAERLEGRVEPPQSAESSPANDLLQEKIKRVVMQ